MPAWLAVVPLLCVGIGNSVFLDLINGFYGEKAAVLLNPESGAAPIELAVRSNAAIWAVQAALVSGIIARMKSDCASKSSKDA